MPSATILIADGTEEIEFVTAYDGKILRTLYPTSPTKLSALVLVRAGFKVQSIGVGLRTSSARYSSPQHKHPL